MIFPVWKAVWIPDEVMENHIPPVNPHEITDEVMKNNQLFGKTSEFPDDNIKQALQ